MNPFKIILLAVFFLFSVDASVAQTERSDRKEQRKLERAEKKRLKEEERQRNKEKVAALVQDQSFVLEANTIYGRYMTPYHVVPTTNFVKIEGNQVVIQTANNFGLGYNGLGGITINGTILDYQVKTSEKRGGASVFIKFTSPVLGHSVLNLNVQKDGSARAMVVDNWGGRFSFQGQFLSPEESTIFKGRSII